MTGTRSPVPTAPRRAVPAEVQAIQRLLDPAIAAVVADTIAQGRKVQITLHFAHGHFDFADAHLMTLRPEQAGK